VDCKKQYQHQLYCCRRIHSIDQDFLNMLLKDAWHLEQFEKNKK